MSVPWDELAAGDMLVASATVAKGDRLYLCERTGPHTFRALMFVDNRATRLVTIDIRALRQGGIPWIHLPVK